MMIAATATIEVRITVLVTLIRVALSSRAPVLSDGLRPCIARASPRRESSQRRSGVHALSSRRTSQIAAATAAEASRSRKPPTSFALTRMSR